MRTQLLTTEEITPLLDAFRAHGTVVSEAAARTVASWYHSPAARDEHTTRFSHGLPYSREDLRREFRRHRDEQRDETEWPAIDAAIGWIDSLPPGAWVIGHDMEEAGETYAAWSDAWDGLQEHASEYADTDDSDTDKELADIIESSPDEYPHDRQGNYNFGDDTPNMRADVDAKFQDAERVRVPGKDWSTSIERNNGLHVHFWMQWQAGRMPTCRGDQQ